jgi:hypothetical protein
MKFLPLVVVSCLLLFPARAAANELKPETLRAWNDYIADAKAQLPQDASSQQVPFLWSDRVAERMQKVKTGEPAVEPALKDNPKKVPHGLIHDWMGAIFIPNTSIDDVMRVLQNYDEYKNYYKPWVETSKALPRDDTEDRFNLVLMQKEFGVTAALDTDNQSQVVKIDATHVYSYSTTTRVQAIDDFGKPSAHDIPQDHGPGYVWRMCTITRLEQRDGGVYMEIETMALSRGIPIEFRWLIKPLTERLPRDTVTKTLKDTRDAVEQGRTAPQPSSSTQHN